MSDAKVTQLRTLRDLERIERREEDNSVRYTNIMLLAPGEWTDAGSRETVWYSPEGIANSVDNWEDNTVNLLHDMDNEVSEVGEVDTDTTAVDDDGNLYGDIVLHMENAASEYADEMMQTALESGGEKGIGGPSVEIPSDITEHNDERGILELVEATFSGVGLVDRPASKPVDMGVQSADRVVALSSAEEADVWTQRTNTDKDRIAGMDPEDLDERLSTIERQLSELAEDGGDDEEGEEEETEMEAVDMAAEYVFEEGYNRDNSLEELVEWSREAEDMDAEVIEEASKEYVEEHNLDSLADATVDMLLEYLEYDDEEEKDDTEMSDLLETFGSLAEDINELADTVTSLQDKDIASRLSALEGDKKDLERELTELKEEPAERTLVDNEETDFIDDSEAAEEYVPEGRAL